MFTTLWQDIQYCTRTLSKNSSFTLVAVITLALGIGANTAIFSVVNTVILKPFAFHEPEQLVVLWERSLNEGLPRMVVSPANFADWRHQNQVFQDMAAYRLQDFNVLWNGDPERVRGMRVSSTMFSLLGVRPLMGRDFQPDEDEPGKPAVVIISHSFWQSRFHGRPDVVGQPIALAPEAATIIGIMPPDFDFPPPITFRGEARSVKVQLWTQLKYALEMDQRSAHNLYVLGRLKPGVSHTEAEGDLRTITQRLATTFPETNKGWDAYTVPLHDQVIGDVSIALWILPVAVAFVLLISCANVANLLLVRATAREREMAIRAALGAGRFRLIRQMLIESTILAVLGAAIGLVLALWAMKLIAALAPQNIYRLDAVSMDGRVVIFTVFATLVTALLFGSIPALKVSRIDLTTALKSGSAHVAGSEASIFRNLFVVGEIALALLLLTGAGLLINSFIRLQTTPTGFQPEQVVAMSLNLPRTSYPDPQSRLGFTARLMSQLVTLPDVKSVAFGTNLPLDVGLQGTEFKIHGEPSTVEQPHTQVSIVSPGYFETLGIQLISGRDFTQSDSADRPGVVIINSDLAQKYFPGTNPVGRRIEMGFRTGVPLEIIAVAANIKQTTLQADFSPGMFIPYTQSPTSLPLIFVLRTVSDSAAVSASVQREVRQLNPELPVYDVKTMKDVLYSATTRPRFMTILLAVFASVAVLLAAIGIYGVMSYTVAQGTREIGIRVALGAQTRDVLKLVIGRGLLLTIVGMSVGIAGAFGLTRLMSTLLFGVSPTDPLTFAIVSAGLLIVALLACYIPARRATRVDPLITLRYE